MTRSTARKCMPVLVAALIVVAAGCSSSSNKSSSATAGTASTTAGAASTPTSAASVTTAATATGLSGSWSGTYQQTSPTSSDGGTFDIQWQQSGSNVNGTIKIPNVCPPGCPINATLNGDTVKFGVVSGITVNYTGTVSGDSMSGTYETADGSFKGTWKASRSG